MSKKRYDSTPKEETKERYRTPPQSMEVYEKEIFNKNYTVGHDPFPLEEDVSEELYCPKCKETFFVEEDFFPEDVQCPKCEIKYEVSQDYTRDGGMFYELEEIVNIHEQDLRQSKEIYERKVNMSEMRKYQQMYFLTVMKLQNMINKEKDEKI